MGGELNLKSWAGYQSRKNLRERNDRPIPADGLVRFIFAPEGRDLAPLNDRELALVQWFECHEPNVSQSVKASLMDWCSPTNASIRAEKFDYGDEFPLITGEGQLRASVGLHAVYMHQILTSGIPYLGYEFGCDWDLEHGLGVLMHGKRCVEVGHADSAVLLWIAEEDARRGGQS